MKKRVCEDLSVRFIDAAKLGPLDQAPDDTLLTPKEVHAVFGFAIVTLRLWARQKRGPRVVSIEGRPRYRLGDLRAWARGEFSAT